ncbi:MULTISPECIES: hypothetical protein [Serratia]|uniref:hypothetical protein n=1 Tax=Serratia TaxID=613 RepID=UPI0010206A27|nr:MULTISPECIES: hypothetical protein [Serratia]TXE64925.1 hypothetical protein FOT59_25515 [Serratia nevei]
MPTNLKKPHVVDYSKVLFPSSSDPKEVFTLSSVAKNINDVLLANSGSAKAALERLFQGNPLGAANGLIEAFLSKSSASLPIVGGFVSIGIGLLFNIFNNLIKKEGPPEPTVEEVIREIAGGMIDQRHYETMQGLVNGIFDTHRSFSNVLNAYLSTKNRLQRDDLRTQLIASFTGFVQTVESSLHLFLIPDLNEKRVAGLPFYCHCAALAVITYNDLLSNYAALELDEKFYNFNLTELRRVIKSWTEEIDRQVQNRYSYLINNASSDSDEVWPAINEFINAFYRNGYAFYITAVKSSAALETGFTVDTRNDVELYAPRKIIGMSYMSAHKWANQRILERVSMMTKISGYSHIDAINRLNVQHIIADGTEINMNYEVCYGEVGRDLEQRINTHFNTNPFLVSAIDAGQMPNNIYSETGGYGSLHELTLQSPNAVLKLGKHRNLGTPVKATNFMPGYFCSGLVIHNQNENGKSCKEDSGVWISLPVEIFRHASGISFAQQFGDDDTISCFTCELGLNSGLIGTTINPSSGYAEPKSGKNVINTIKGSTNQITFRIFNHGRKRKVKSISPVIFMAIRDNIEPFYEKIRITYNDISSGFIYFSKIKEGSDGESLFKVKGIHSWEDSEDKIFYLSKLDTFHPYNLIIDDYLDVKISIDGDSSFASLNLEVVFD